MCRNRIVPVIVGVLFLAGIGGGVIWWRHRASSRATAEHGTRSPVIGQDLARISAVPPPEAGRCVECHPQEVAEWIRSQHAAANRLFDRKGDFAVNTEVLSPDGTKTIIQGGGKEPSVTILNPGGDRAVYHPEAVIGVTPLVQFLIPFPGGRLQVLNLSFDPEEKEWFDAQASEPRTAEDWSHWTQRGMNWNSQCAFCHMTNLQKGYDPKTDSYATKWDAMGIACAQCHGEMDKHSAAPKDPRYFNRETKKQALDNCGSCHARREQLTDSFRAGNKFTDHFRLILPDTPGIYHADGQVKEEDFEYGSFLMSRMGHKGISCLDCHNPHSGKLKLPVGNNALCMSCHTPPGQRGAVPVDVVSHSHHQAGTPGDRCVDCHMPQTRYMERDPRRDHGFTIPDPLLTKELGIPNACNRCHEDKSVDWAIEFTSQWYGQKMERRSRQRARVIARAEKGDRSAGSDLLAMAKGEEIDAWRAALTSMLAPWMGESGVRAYLEKSLSDSSPLVRSVAVNMLGMDPAAAPLIRPLCDDPARLVRLDAEWALHGKRDKKHPAYDELLEYLRTISDQPAGALRNAQLAMEENRIDDAMTWSGKAAAWDATSAQARQSHAMVLNSAGKRQEAIAELHKAAELEPRNPEHPYLLALLYGEAGKEGEVVGLLKKAVNIDPGYGRAWYNLGLALAAEEKLNESTAALERAEKLLPGSPDVPYALATVYARANRLEDARKAASRAEGQGYEPASQLLRQLSR